MEAYKDLKAEIRQDLQHIVTAFNADMALWWSKHSSYANFRWTYDEDSGRKKLTIAEIMMPIVQSDPSKEDLEKASDILGKTE
jgi:hypothetical protein